jgi:hypothetical protein
LADEAFLPAELFFGARVFFIEELFAVAFFTELALVARFFFLAIKLHRFTVERLPAPGAVNRPRLGERKVVVPTARAGRLERVAAASDAIRVVRFVRAEAPADGTPFRDAIGHAKS